MPAHPHEGETLRQKITHVPMKFFDTPVISASILSSISIHPYQEILTHDVTEYLHLVVAQDVTRPSGKNEGRLPVPPDKGGDFRAEDVSHFDKDLKCLSFVVQTLTPERTSTSPTLLARQRGCVSAHLEGGFAQEG